MPCFLRHLQIVGTEEEMVAAWKDAGGHALTLQLLGRFLADAHGGDIRHYKEGKVRGGRPGASGPLGVQGDDRLPMSGFGCNRPGQSGSASSRSCGSPVSSIGRCPAIAYKHCVPSRRSLA